MVQKSPREGLPGLNPLELENGTVLGGLASRSRGSEGAKGGPGLVQGRGWGGGPGTRHQGKDLEGGKGPKGGGELQRWQMDGVSAPPSSLWPSRR